MLEAQWREGMVPQIRYDPRYSKDYFPSPDRWPRAQSHVAQPGVLTTGTTNPPVLISVARWVGLAQPDLAMRHAFWQRTFSGFKRWLQYLQVGRRLGSTPLIAMVHPWESGCENSPRWDSARAAKLTPRRPYKRLDTRNVNAAQRPTDRDYDTYLALVELLETTDYDVLSYADSTPFCAYDVLFDAAWYAAAEDLNQIGADIGQPAPFTDSELKEFASAFEDFHWDPELGLYVDWNYVAQRRIITPTAAGLMPMAAGLVSSERGRAIWRRYEALEDGALSVCTVPPSEAEFDPRGYWRGPVWLNINWLVIRGLERCGLLEEATDLTQKTLNLVRNQGFAEYFDAMTGDACGIGSFSWTAAITLDMLTHRKPLT